MPNILTNKVVIAISYRASFDLDDSIKYLKSKA